MGDQLAVAILAHYIHAGDPNYVTLTPDDLTLATVTAIQRHDEAVTSGRRDTHGLFATRKKSIENHFLGCRGEIACCRYYGLSITLSTNTYKEFPDVAHFDVRTRSKEDYELLVRPGDPDHRPIVLVVESAIPVAYKVIGWMYGWEAKQKKWFRDHADRPKAYFVPQAILHPEDTLVIP